MTLEERYATEANVTLIKILENAELYTEECIAVVKKELDKRNFDDRFKIGLAETLMREKIKKILDSFDPYNDKLRLPESQFLNDEQIKDIFKEEFDLFIETKEAMKVDVWKYAIGGILAI